MRSALTLLALFGIGVCGACGADEDCDAYCCQCERACRAGISTVGTASNDAPATCVGSPLCNTDDECPAAIASAITPTCVSNGDLVQNGYGGTCMLLCQQGDACPGELECVSGVCKLVTFDPSAPCTSDDDCQDGFECRQDACDAPLQCHPPGGVCMMSPVCGCDGVTYPNGCDRIREPYLHYGECEP